MYIPKEDIYEKLQETGVTVLQGAQETYPNPPVITFTISDNSTELDLDNEIASQSIIVSVDIWTDTSMEASALLNASEILMRELGYKMTYSADVPRPEGALHHINCRFETTRQEKIWLEPELWAQPSQ